MVARERWGGERRSSHPPPHMLGELSPTERWSCSLGTQGGSSGSSSHRVRPLRAVCGPYSGRCSALCWPALPSGLGSLGGGWVRVAETGWTTVWLAPFPRIRQELL